jgi:hypothetical protein
MGQSWIADIGDSSAQARRAAPSHPSTGPGYDGPMVRPKRFHLPILFGIIDVTKAAVQLAHFECATGQRWEPGSGTA